MSYHQLQTGIVSSAVFGKSGEVAAIGQAIPAEIRKAVIHGCNLESNAQRVFVSSQLLSGRMLAMIVRNEHAFLAVFHSQLPIKIPLAYLLELSDVIQDSTMELSELLHLMEERMQFYSSDELSNDFQLRAVTRRVNETVLEPLDSFVRQHNQTECSSLLKVYFYYISIPPGSFSLISIALDQEPRSNHDSRMERLGAAEEMCIDRWRYDGSHCHNRHRHGICRGPDLTRVCY